MRVDPSDYSEIPDNPHGLAAGCLLRPTTTPIVLGGGTSLDFVREQGGGEDTLILLFGVRRESALAGPLSLLEGVFLNADGPGFHPTWGFDQLLREVTAGGWTVIPTAEVLERWVDEVEARANR